MHGFMELQTRCASFPPPNPETRTSIPNPQVNHKLLTQKTPSLHALPTPPPLLPIPTPTHLLRILKTYTTPPSLSLCLPLAIRPISPPPPIPVPVPTLTLLPHLTSAAPLRPLSVHVTNVLSDLCQSVKEVAELAGTDGGRGVLGEWLGGEEGRGVAEFWEGEWIVE